MSNVEVVDFSDTLVEVNNPCPEIYPRFKKVRTSLIEAVYGCPDPEIHRDFKSLHWPEGIIDYNGKIVGISNGIQLNFTAQGTTVPEQPDFVINDDGEWIRKTRRDEFVTLNGNFISKDGLEGAIDIVASDGNIVFEGYWLEDLHGDLILEQVVDINRNVHTLEDIEEMPINQIYVCRDTKESNDLFSIGVTASQIFYIGIDKIGKFERMQKNRELKVPGLKSPIPMRKRKIRWGK